MSAVDIVPIASADQWPPNIICRAIYPKEIFFLQKLWKSVDKTQALEHIKTYDEESIFYKFQNEIENQEEILIGQNPFDKDHNIFFVRSPQTRQFILTILDQLDCTYNRRVSIIKSCPSRDWISFGSEQEVDESRVETTREKISVEWIGNLEKRYESVNFVQTDVDYVHFPSTQTYTVIRKSKLDICIQVSVEFHNVHTQTTSSEIAQEFLSLDIVEDATQELQPSCYEQTDTSTVSVERQESVYDVSLSYYKSFINMEKRTKQISCVSWHPTKPGYVAVAYTTADKPQDENIIDANLRFQDTLTTKARKTINDNDIEINESIFDVTAPKCNIHDESASETGSVEDESEDEKSITEDKFDIENVIIYKSTSSPLPDIYTDKDHLQINDQSDDLKWATDMLKIDESSSLPQESDTSSQSSASLDSIESESSASSLKTNLPIKVAVYEDFSDDSDSVEDDLPITDTDSSVLLWNCENDLTPQLDLYNIHDVHVIKFYPVDGNLLAGGSRSGQLVVWDIHDEFEKSATNHDSKEISEFMQILPGWQTDDSKCPIIYPAAISNRNISHIDRITDLEWIHPSLKLSLTGSLTKGKTYSKHLLTSSLDGSIKVWEFQPTQSDTSPVTWNLQIIYNVNVTNPHLEKYSSSIETFKLSNPPGQYTLTSNGYEFVSEINHKINQSIILANIIGEIGVIKFTEKKDSFIDSQSTKTPENCKHEWWATCHDSSVTSLSQNYFFPNIALSTGGRIFALWNVDFKNGPIWWKQYPFDISITTGCFTPYHPGIIYIARSDGKVDIWNIIEQLHAPVLQVTATGYKIMVLSVVTPPNPEYQLSVADSNGIFHVLNNRYDVTWNENDYKSVEIFFRRAEECKKQLLHWNKHWKELSTVTDQYGFQYKPQQKTKPVKYSTQKNTKHRSTESSLVKKITKPVEKTFLDQIADTDNREILQKIIENVKTPLETSIVPYHHPISINDIRDLYCKTGP